ncbi:MAG: phosphatase PAP2 family protein, partial [Actinobacteria bacterium]|nr:phosphatase PAP2 family protein [Actinomycetota bacterium]
MPSRAGDVLKQPLVWAGFAVALSLTGPRGRRAALRGAACSATASLIHLPIKHVIGRRRPRGAGLRGPGPLTTSFPSGHTASNLGFMFGAAQELPLLIVPLTVATLGSHWSLIRARKHYPSDVIGGGAIALAVTAAAWKIHPPRRDPRNGPARVRPRADRLRAAKRGYSAAARSRADSDRLALLRGGAAVQRALQITALED